MFQDIGTDPECGDQTLYHPFLKGYMLGGVEPGMQRSVNICLGMDDEYIP